MNGPGLNFVLSRKERYNVKTICRLYHEFDKYAIIAVSRIETSPNCIISTNMGEERKQLSKRWVLEEQDIPEHFRPEFPGLSQTEMELLFQRGIKSSSDAEKFLNPLNGDILQGARIPGMDEAASRVLRAIFNGDRICIYGDYDTDGITAVAIMTRTLSQISENISYYLPDREDHGYGLNFESLRELRERGEDLIIAVDCGVRAVKEAAYAVSIGLDLIIIDHHLPDDDLPENVLIVDPKATECSDLFNEYCGAGLSYLLALRIAEVEKSISIDSDILALAGIATIADMVPLTGPNLVLASKGVEALKTTRIPGLLALYENAGIRKESITSTSVGFIIAPRINATGRVASAEIAVKLLLEEDHSRAKALADQVEMINNDRKISMSETIEIVRARLTDLAEIPPIIFLEDERFVEGVVGLAASRIAEEYHRPVIIGAKGMKHVRASARSIKGINIVEILDQLKEHLVRFGGHDQAAGLTIANSDLEDFRQKLLIVGARALENVELVPNILISSIIEFCDLKPSILEFLERMEPFGVGNPYPLFATRNAQVVNARSVGAGKEHLKLTLQKKGTFFDAIAFRQGHFLETMGRTIDVAYRFEWNEYLGVKKMQLNIEDIKESL